MRKVSKVSILSTTRKIDDKKVSTIEKLIPLKQHTIVEAGETLLNSHEFSSLVKRQPFGTLSQSPGPGSYAINFTHNQ